MKLVSKKGCMSDDCWAGMLQVNKSTVGELQERLAQGRENSDASMRMIMISLMSEHGYKKVYPLIMNEDGIVVDGFTRCKAMMELISRYDHMEFEAPFVMVTGAQIDEFNNTRGISTRDLMPLFKRSAANGYRAGNAHRNVLQAEEACMFLDVGRCGLNVAFDSRRTQEHFSKIQQNEDLFREAFMGVTEVCKRLEESPDIYKISHWLAFFARHGVANSTLSIAQKYILLSRGESERPDRLKAFQKMSADLVEFSRV